MTQFRSRVSGFFDLPSEPQHGGSGVIVAFSNHERCAPDLILDPVLTEIGESCIPVNHDIVAL